MLVSLAWRNLTRSPLRSILAGAAVAFGLVLIIWMRGFQDGSYVQFIDSVVRTRLGHVQVLPQGYLDDPRAELTIDDAGALVERLGALGHVEAVTPRAVSEGVLSRDAELARADLLGVDPAAEARASTVPARVLEGDAGLEWCREELGRALEVMGGDQRLFDRWCAAAGSSRYLPADNPRAVVVGAGLARRLLVSVGDEITVQVVRAVGSQEPGAGEGRGSLSQRRLEVTGVVRTGNPEIDDRVAYLHLATLEGMLGTRGPNEVVVVLDDIARLDAVRAAVAQVVRGRPVDVTTWAERNPQLKSAIDLDSRSGVLMYLVLVLLVAVGVVNATMMSVLERRKEFGVMLALGMRRASVFALVMLEVTLLGLAAIAVGSALGAGLEVFGRVHGWPMEWFGMNVDSGMSMSGAMYESIYYSRLSPAHGAIILVGMYLMFLVAGLVPAIIAARLKPVEAVREQ
jgi:ABC-type lipoprotein release transport system permease subunit